MRKRILDTSVLIRFWHQRRKGRPLANITVADVQGWGRELSELHDTKAIVTPVHVELLAGAMGKHELRLTRAYLAQFEALDRGTITPDDWKNVIRLAQRVPLSPKPRDLGDCLIRAIADRLNYDVLTFDQSFTG